MRGFVAIGLTVLAVSGCTLPYATPENAAKQCAERARAAKAPTGSITIGTNSKSGGFTNASIGVSSDFLSGRDPDVVYDECYLQRTGEMPIRRPVLR